MTIQVLDAQGDTEDVKTSLDSSEHVPHHNVDDVIPGTGATNLGKAVDSAAGSTDTGTAALVVRDDALTTLTPVDGDYTVLRVGSTGALHTTDTQGAALAVTGGGVESSALRVTVASDSTGVLSVDDNGGSLTVDNAQLSVVGAGTEAAAMRVTIANDSTGLLSVDDNGGSLTVDNAQLSVVGSGTEAAAMRVTIASDSTGLLSVDDNGGSLTVDNADITTLAGTVATDDTTTHSTGSTTGISIMAAATPTDGSVAANDIGSVAMSTDRRLHTDTQIVGQDADLTIADGGNSITVDNAALSVTGGGVESGALRVTLASDSTGVMSVDDNGGSLTVDNADITTVASAVSAFDTAAGGTDPATVIAAVRDDALTTLTPADGDYVPLRVSSTGALHVTGAGGGTQYNVDDAAGGTDTGNALLVVRDDTLTTLTPADGDYTTLRVSSTGALHVTGGGGGTEYTEDAAGAGGETGNFIIGRRNDTMGTSPVGTDGDYHGVQFDAVGNLRTAAAYLVDAGNSRSPSTLDGGTTYTGTFIDCSPYSVVTVLITSDDAESGTLHIDFSMAGSTADRDISIAVADSSSHPPHTVAVVAQYVRIRFVADGSSPTNDHGNFATQMILHSDKSKGLTSRAAQTISDITDVDNTRAIIVGKTSGGSYVNVGTTNNGGIKTALEEYDGVPTGGGVESGSLRVTLANDSTGLVSVDDNGGSLTVDNAALSVTGGGVESGAMRVTIASDSTGLVSVDDNGGSLTVDNADITTLAGTVSTDDTTTHSTGTTTGINIMAAATPTDDAVAANDIGQVAMSLDRRLHTQDVRLTTADTTYVANGAINADLTTAEIDCTEFAVIWFDFEISSTSDPIGSLYIQGAIASGATFLGLPIDEAKMITDDTTAITHAFASTTASIITVNDPAATANILVGIKDPPPYMKVFYDWTSGGSTTGIDIGYVGISK